MINVSGKLISISEVKEKNNFKYKDLILIDNGILFKVRTSNIDKGFIVNKDYTVPVFVSYYDSNIKKYTNNGLTYSEIKEK